MFLTRKGYHTLVIVWLGLMCVIDVVANTLLTGLMSEVYFWKVILDGGLIWWTAAYLKEDMAGNVLSSQAAAVARAQLQRQQAAVKGDESIIGSIESLSGIEYIYYFFMAGYGGANFVFHHALNKASTGPLSLTTLVLSIVDGIIVAVAAVNLWNMYRGNVVRFTKSLVSEQK